MSTDKLRVAYIASLLILASLLVLFAQGVFSGLYDSSSKASVEIDRIDLYDDFLGNYSKVSVMVSNNDSISHNFTINTFFDDDIVGSYNLTLNTGKTFTYQVDVLPTEVLLSDNMTIGSNLKVAKFVVYLDNQAKPIEETSFIFND